MIARVLGCVILAGLVGCASSKEHLPTYPRMSDGESIHTIAARSEKTKSVTAQGLITLRDSEGQTVRLDCVIVMRPPNELRLRAWKFGQAVFDLTLTSEGAWLIAPEDPKRRAQVQTAGVSAAKLARTWSVLAGGFFADPNVTVVKSSGSRLVVSKPNQSGAVIFCDIDRRTLTPRQYRMIDDKGATRFTLTLDRYATFGDTVWPQRVVAISDRGEIDIDLKDIEINGEIPEQAFKPPRRAEKLP
jgi:outer membrane lipoprotein-sorting protein